MKIKKSAFIILNIILFLLLLWLLFFIILESPTQWADPSQFDSDAVDVIRFFSILEVFISLIIGLINRKKRIILALLILSNLCTIYNVITTYIII